MATTFFFDIFIIKTVGKGHRLMLRPLFLIGVWHIKQKRRACLRWLYNLLGGGLTKRMTYVRVVFVLRLYLLEQCLNPVLWTLIKTRNFATFYKFLIHVGMHHTKKVTVWLFWRFFWIRQVMQTLSTTLMEASDNFVITSEVALCPLLPWYCVKSSRNVWFRNF